MVKEKLLKKKRVNSRVFNYLIVLIILLFLFTFTLAGCKTDVSKNVNSENINTDVSEKVKLDAAYLPLRDSKENINTILAKESSLQTDQTSTSPHAIDKSLQTVDKSPQTLEELVKAFDSYAEADKEYYKEHYDLRENSKSFLLINQTLPSKKGVLLIHGLGASPNEMRELGDFLYSNGFSVLGVRLSGHGGNFEYLESSNWKNWYQDVEYSYNILEHLSDEVYVVGISTGATLGLMLAEKEEEGINGEGEGINRKEEGIKGIVVIAPAIIMKDWKLKFISLIKYFVKSQKRILSEEEKATYNEFLPTKTLEQLMKLIKIDKTSLNKVNEPILIIQATNDPRVKKESAEYVYEHVGTAKDKKQITWIESDEHVIITGETKDEVFGDVLGFLIAET